MARALKCPNCRAPLKLTPEELAELVTCTYCGHQIKLTQRAIKRATGGGNLGVAIGVVVVAMVLFGALPPLLCVLFEDDSSSGGSSPTPRPAPKPKPKPVDPRAVAKKMQRDYVDCLRDTFERVRSAERRYRYWAPDTVERLTCKERYTSHGTYGISINAACGRLLKHAGAAPPGLEKIHAAGKAYLAAFRALEPVQNKANRYYDRKTYAVDDCAEGKKMHPKMLAGYKAVRAARLDLREQLAAATKGSLKRCIDEHAKDPARRAWAAMIEAAGDVVKVCRAQDPKNSEVRRGYIHPWKWREMRLEPPYGDPSAIKAALKRYTTALGRLDALEKKQKDEMRYSPSSTDKLVEKALCYTALIDPDSKASTRCYYESVVMAYNELLKRFNEAKICPSLIPCERHACPGPR